MYKEDKNVDQSGTDVKSGKSLPVKTEFMRLRIVFVFFIFVHFTYGQQKPVRNVDISNTTAVYHGKTLPMSSYSSGTRQVTSNAKKKHFLPPNFENRGRSNARFPEKEHTGPDPLRQLSNNRSFDVAVEPIVNIPGLSNRFVRPHDPTGAIGKNHFVQVINGTQIGVFNKQGISLGSFTGRDLWRPIGESSAGDPIVLYDHELDRWLITEFAPKPKRLLLIAVSETPDPLGSYFVHSFVTPFFPDYPKYAIWSKAIVVTTNEAGSASLHQYFIDREAIMSGQDEVAIRRIVIRGNTDIESAFFVSSPVHWVGSNPPPDDANPFVVRLNDSSWGQTENDQIEIYSFDINFSTSVNNPVVMEAILTTPFDSYPCSVSGERFSCVPQKDGSGLDALPEIITNVPQYRRFQDHESVVLTFVTDVTDGENLSGIRWVELRRSDSDESWSLFQEGTYAPDDGLDRYMSTISIDEQGNIGLVYNASSENDYVSLRFTGRFANDPLGVMGVREYVLAEGLNPIISKGRFGDYAQLLVDPVDNRTFWGTAEYAGSGQNTAVTRIFAFQLRPLENDLSVLRIISPVTSGALGNQEQVTVEIENFGSEEASDFQLTLRLNGKELEQLQVADTLASLGKAQYTFKSLLDLSVDDEYSLEVEIKYAEDQVSGNNSLVVLLRRIVNTNATLLALEIDSVFCSTSAISGVVSFRNNGSDELTQADLIVKTNSSVEYTLSWRGNLRKEESTELPFTLDSTIEGNNDIEIMLINPNNVEDQIPNDNSISTNLNKNFNLLDYKLILTTDSFPDETFWQVRDENENIIYRRDAYLIPGVYTEAFCLDREGCYTFEISDQSSDGICCAFGAGSYRILDSNNKEIFASDGRYGSSESYTFCANYECSLSISVSSKNPEGTELGSILIEATGARDYQYSIDNGQSYQDKGLFENLESGIYDVMVRSNLEQSCVQRKTVVLQRILGIEKDAEILVRPNPNTGVFEVALAAESTVDQYALVQILDINGRIVQERIIGKYDNVYKGQISLYPYPDGIYLVRFPKFKNRYARIIKRKEE